MLKNLLKRFMSGILAVSMCAGGLLFVRPVVEAADGVIWVVGNPDDPSQNYASFSDQEGVEYLNKDYPASKSDPLMIGLPANAANMMFVTITSGVNTPGFGSSEFLVGDGSTHDKADGDRYLKYSLSTANRNNYLKIDGKTSSDPATADSYAYIVEQKIMIDSSTADAQSVRYYMEFSTGTGVVTHCNLLHFKMSDNGIYYQQIDGDPANGQGSASKNVLADTGLTFQTDSWMTVTFVLRISDMATYDAYVNGQLAVSEAPLTNAGTVLDRDSQTANNIQQQGFTGMQSLRILPLGQNERGGDCTVYLDDYRIAAVPSAEAANPNTVIKVTEDSGFVFDGNTVSNVFPYENIDSFKQQIVTEDPAATMRILKGTEDVTANNDQLITSDMKIRVTAPNGITQSDYKIVIEDVEMPEISEVSVAGDRIVRVGGTLSGSYIYNAECGIPEAAEGSAYQWQRISTEGAETIIDIPGATGQTYQPTQEDLGYKIRLQVIPKCDAAPYRGIAVYSEEFGPVQPSAVPPQKPEARDMAVEGYCYSGRTLSATYTFWDINLDEEGATEFCWVTSENENAGPYTKIPGTEQQKTYVLQESDIGKYVYFAVLPKKADGYQEPLGEWTYEMANSIIADEPINDDIKYLNDSKLGASDLKAVTKDLLLLREGRFGSKIEWSSSNPDVVGVDGTVKRQASDTAVTLTATLTSFDDTITKNQEFDVIVAAKPRSGSSGGSGGSGGSGSSGGGRGSGNNIVSMPNEMYHGDFNAPLDRPLHVYEDVPMDYWAMDYIQELYYQGIAEGTPENNFEPERDVTREEFVKMIVQAFGLLDENAVVAFDDVKPEEWYYPYIASAYKSLIIDGVGNDKFGVGDCISRQDMAVIAYKTALIKGIKLPDKEETVVFSDEAEIAPYAKEAVVAMQCAGIMNGVGGNSFAPEDYATRAEVAKIIALLMDCQ